MISRKQLSKNLYKLTKKEFPEIFGNETDDDDTEVDSLGWWSSIDEAIEYCESGVKASEMLWNTKKPILP